MESKYLENLTEAVYRVTDRMEDAEPLRWKIRASALAFSELYHEDASSLSLREEDARARQLTSLLASMIRLLSLASSLSYVARINFDILLQGYADLEKKLLLSKSPSLLAKTDEMGKNRDSESSRGEFSSRQQKILEFLAISPSANIGELSVKFENEVSEKTIQRELNELTLRGAVRAVGEKRWRRYSIGHA